jgi:hypothetical protein
MGKYKEMLNSMNPKVVSYIQDNPDVVTEAKNDLIAKLDFLMESDGVHEETILDQYRIELIARISHVLARDTQESYIDCMEVAEFYVDRIKML